MEGFNLGGEELRRVFEVLRNVLETKAMHACRKPDWPFYDRMAEALGQPGLEDHYNYIRQKVEDGSWE